MVILEAVLLIGGLSFGVHFVSNALVDVYEDAVGPIDKGKKKKKKRR